MQRIALVAKTFAGWALDRGDEPPLPARIAVIEDHSGKLTEIDSAKGVLRGAPDMSGWVRVTARIAGRQVFEAYMDRPYEERPIWPACSDPGSDEEGPGCAGKHLRWISLSLRDGAWPELEAIAVIGLVNIAISDQ